jgi:hypothetical protein
MPKRKEPELDPKEQFKRFQETAKRLEVDERGNDIEREFDRLARPSKAKDRKKSSR